MHDRKLETDWRHIQGRFRSSSLLIGIAVISLFVSQGTAGSAQGGHGGGGGHQGGGGGGGHQGGGGGGGHQGGGGGGGHQGGGGGGGQQGGGGGGGQQGGGGGGGGQHAQVRANNQAARAVRQDNRQEARANRQDNRQSARADNRATNRANQADNQARHAANQAAKQSARNAAVVRADNRADNRATNRAVNRAENRADKNAAAIRQVNRSNSRAANRTANRADNRADKQAAAVRRDNRADNRADRRRIANRWDSRLDNHARYRTYRKYRNNWNEQRTYLHSNLANFNQLAQLNQQQQALIDNQMRAAYLSYHNNNWNGPYGWNNYSDPRFLDYLQTRQPSLMQRILSALGLGNDDDYLYSSNWGDERTELSQNMANIHQLALEGRITSLQEQQLLAQLRPEFMDYHNNRWNGSTDWSQYSDPDFVDYLNTRRPSILTTIRGYLIR